MSQSDRPGGGGALAALHMRAGHALIRVRGLFRPQLSLGVRLAAFDHEGRVFLVRHSYLPGLHLPGGAVDPGETCGQAAAREAAEEGGLVMAGPPVLFQIYWHRLGGRSDHVVLFVARGVTQGPVPPRGLEIMSAGFHPADPLPEDVTGATRRRVAEVLAGRAETDLW